ncbi:hypothetical protein SDC9_158389 [bioreactor metagenome]|uniref:Bacteriophage T5 Orf172 DNA-binding domain-containing protein n=1 Tax=bioreactor metagenome TaxID=1076179 RepID=A0A645F9N6_9ZZZZ
METYKYKDLPITPAIIEVLIIELFNGQTLKRDDIVKIILEHHISNGGLRPEAKDFPRSVKKALSNMQKKGDTINKSYGFWEIHKNEAPIQTKENTIKETPIDQIPTHNIYGKGDNAIYFYYLPSYKTLAQVQGKNTWRCKIGRTDRDPLSRILSQSSTALPEIPIVEFIVKTENASILETMIHSILTIRNKHIKDSPGIEWFDTNPEEVLDIIKYARKDII